MFICPGCGANLRFSPEKQKLVCDSCSSEFTTKEYNDRAALSARKYDDKVFAVTVFTCPQCGGELLTQDDTAATFCSYCGTSVMLESRIEEQMKPDFVIPFQVSKEDCEKAYKKLIQKARYIPKDMKDEQHIAQFRGIYMPYWVYDYEMIPLKFPHKKTRDKGDYHYVDYYDVKVDAHGTVDGIAFDASSSFSDNLSSSIAPYKLDERQTFSPAYLSGFYADSNDIDEYTYSRLADEAASEAYIDELKKSHGFQVHGVSTDELREGAVMNKKKPKLAFLPVWFLATKNKDGSRVSYAVVNGQTGKVAADLPVDFTKYLWTSLVLAIPIFLLLNLFLTLTPGNAVSVSIALAIYAIFVAKSDQARLRARVEGTDDLGLQTKRLRDQYGDKYAPKKAPAEEQQESKAMSVAAVKMRQGLYNDLERKEKERVKERNKKLKKDKGYIKLPVIGIIIGILVCAVGVQDITYYGASAVISGLVALTFFKIVKDKNLLTTRRLPQLGKRGGEENV